jgi:FlaA1/EpsC-like NDP-sugar epimerase
MYLLSNGLIEQMQLKVNRIYQQYSVPRAIVLVADTFAVVITFLFAYLLRFNFVLTDFEMEHAVHHALLALAIYTISFLLSRSYAGLLRYTTVADILKVFLSTSYSFFVLLLISFLTRWIYWEENLVIPISILIIHYVLISVWLVFVRINVKIVYGMVTSSFIEKKHVLIFGAEEMGAVVKRVIQSDDNSIYQIVGFMDENKNLKGKKLDGIEVYSPLVLTPSFIKKHKIDVFIFAISELSSGKKSKLIQRALDLGLEVLEPPSIDTWMNGKFQIHQIQKIKLEDLLGREPIRLNMRKIGMELIGKTILVTGAAGSIGSEIVRQLTRFNIKKLILIDQAETPMFNLENELRSGYRECPVELILADVTNMAKMSSIFEDHHPEIVFHAAAYKHVPLMEENPHEAIRVNVGGTRIMTGLSMRHGVKKFVMISTDKAVNPTNVMGASKRICEMLVQFKTQNSGNKSQFIVTRFGNVLGSNGSVIPIFRKQIEEGGPVTVTHPEVTRYFMTIPEACQLVLEAGFMGKGGEIFVFDMGSPVKIADLASQMIRLSGLVPEKDIKIVYTGLRPGEKLYEELLTNRENTKSTTHSKIKIAQVEKLDKITVLVKIDDLLSNLYSFSKHEVVDYCRELVPEFKSANIKYMSESAETSLLEGRNVIEL